MQLRVKALRSKPPLGESLGDSDVNSIGGDEEKTGDPVAISPCGRYGELAPTCGEALSMRDR